MRTMVNLSERTFDRVKDLIEAGRYSSLQKFIQVAVENQLGLEESESDDAGLRSSSRAGSRQNGNEKELFGLADFRVPSDLDESILPRVERHSTDELGYTEGKGQWIWGQVNNVLAIKFVTRSLLLRQMQVEGMVEQEKWFGDLNREATQVQKRLATLDEEASRSRVTAWSKSFPSEDSASTKRFSRQYGGEVRQNGRVVGALPWLGLIAWLRADSSGDREWQVGLTRLGRRFARLPNPVLDGQVSERNSVQKLSDSEKEFYTERIAQKSKPEAEAFTCIASILGRMGKVASAKLREEIGQHYGEWSDTQATTYSGGALARMDDVDLIERHHPGTARASYAPTKALLRIFGERVS